MTKPTHTLAATPAHEVAYDDLIALMRKHTANMTELEILAIAANMLGKIIALQDSRVTTREKALEVVMKNIEIGNAQVIAGLLKGTGSA